MPARGGSFTCRPIFDGACESYSDEGNGIMCAKRPGVGRSRRMGRGGAAEGGAGDTFLHAVREPVFCEWGDDVCVYIIFQQVVITRLPSIIFDLT